MNKIISKRIIAGIIVALLAILVCIFGILSSLIRFVIVGCMIAMIAKVILHRDPSYNIFIWCGFIFLYMLFMMNIQVISLTTKTPFVYPLQSAYIATLGNLREPDWFPESMENVKGNFVFNYVMTYQDPGRYSVAYETTHEYIEELKKKYIPLADKAKQKLYDAGEPIYYYALDDLNVYSMNENEIYSEKTVQTTTEIYGGEELTKTIFPYIIDKNEEFWNYPDRNIDAYVINYNRGDDWFTCCGVLLIDEKACKIEFRDQ